MNSFKNKNGIKLSNVYVLNNYLLSECLSKARCDFISKTLLEDGPITRRQSDRKGHTWHQEPTWGRGRTHESTRRQDPGLLYTRPGGQAIPTGAGQKTHDQGQQGLVIPTHPLFLREQGDKTKANGPITLACGAHKVKEHGQD